MTPTVTVLNKWILAAVLVLTTILYAPSIIIDQPVYEDVVQRQPITVPSITASPSRDLSAVMSSDDIHVAHATSLAVHLACGILVAVLAAQLGVAWWSVAAMIFLLHPINTEAVAYAAARAEVAVTLVILVMSTLVLSRALEEMYKLKYGYAVGAISGALGALMWAAIHTKETGVMAVVLVPLLYVHRFGNIKHRVFMAVSLAALMAYSVHRIGMEVVRTDLIARTSFTDGYTWAEYFTGQAVSINRLVGTTLLMLSPNADPDIYPHISNPYIWTAFRCVIALWFAIWIVTDKYRARVTGLSALAAIWTVVSLWPRFIIRSEWLTDYQWYLPMIAISIALAACFDKLQLQELRLPHGRKEGFRRRPHDETVRGSSFKEEVDCTGTGRGK